MKCRTEQERLSADTFTQNPMDFGSAKPNSFNKDLTDFQKENPKFAIANFVKPNIIGNFKNPLVSREQLNEHGVTK